MQSPIPIVDVIKLLIPDITVESLNLLPIDRIQFAETLNLYFHIDQRDASQRTAIITPQVRQSEDVTEESSIVLLPAKATQQEGQPDPSFQAVPFSSGSHLIINQASWWDTPRTVFAMGKQLREGKQLQLCPVLADEEARSITTPSKGQKFWVELNSENLLKVEVWTKEKITVDFSARSPLQSKHAAGSTWTFERYSPAQIVKFKEETLSQVVFSFDQDLVKEAILITRERSVSRDYMENEYYVLVLRK